MTSILAKAISRADSYINTFKGLGDALYDALAQTKAKTATDPGPEYWENLIRVNRLARRIASLPAREMLREGYEIQVADDPDFDELPLMDEVKRLRIDVELEWALTLARATGGAVIVPFIVDGTSDFREPLNLDRIQEIKELRVVSRKSATPVGPGSPIYRIASASNGGTIEMHESRLIVFDGERVTDDAKANNGGWGDSILLAVEEALARLGTSWQALGNMLVDGSQGVLKIRDFHDMIAGNAGGDEAIRMRYRLMAHGRSVARALAIDADGEDFQFINRQFAGISDSIYALMSEVSSLTGIPITKLFGRSAAGMNATGEGDRSDWFNEVSGERKVKLEPNHEKLLRMVMRQRKPGLGAEPKRWSISYNPMYQPTDKEQAELRKLTSEADAIDITNQVLTPEEVAISRYGGKKYSTSTQIDTTLREAPAASGDSGTDPVTATPGVGSGADNVQQTVLNGAQVTSLVDVVKSVASGELPRDSGVEIVMLSFGLTNEQAEKVMADAGNGFEPTKKEPPQNEPGQPDGAAPNRGQDVPG